MNNRRTIDTRRLKDIGLHIARRLGLFALARHITRGGLRILCYHGFELEDETGFRPKLFMRPGDFEGRMALLAAAGYPVLPLQEALDRLARGTLPQSAVVITIDDGFHSVRAAAAPILKRFGFPATVYVTTYYVDKHAPIFRLAVGYIVAFSPRMRIECGPRPWLPGGELRLDNDDARARLVDDIVEYGEQRCTEDERQRICRELAALLLIDYDALRRTRLVSLMDREELLELKQFDIDVQLHTHRHRFPLDESAATKEIADNRRAMRELVGRERFEHFCYPSGVYDPIQWPWLSDMGIASATTCEAGLNYRDTPRFRLQRFLDDSLVSPITFEAEMSGFLEIARRCRTHIKRLHSRIVSAMTPPRGPIEERVGHSQAELL